jgi:recombination protein RecA
MTKETIIKTLIDQVDKKYGKGSLLFLNQINNREDTIPVFSTKSFALDYAIGVGGIPVGRITEIYGPESSGKTTLSLRIASSCTDQGKTVAFIDVEHALDFHYASSLGIKKELCIISQPNSGEEALNIVELLVQKQAVDLIIVDSVAALVTKAELDGDMGAHHVGGHARLMSQALKKITPQIKNTTIIFINQMRMKIGVLFGNPETTTGGNALKFYASLRLDVRKTSYLKQAEQVIGQIMKVRVVKNKMAAPFGSADIELFYGKNDLGIEKDVITIATNLGIIKLAGSWYSYKDQRLGQGKEKAQENLQLNQNLLEEIKETILEYKSQ